MNRAKTARWVTRFVGLAMIVAALVALRVMEGQLRRIGKTAERTERPKPELRAPPMPSTQLPVVQLPPPPPPDELDSLEYVPSDFENPLGVPEQVRLPGEVPEGAVR